MKWKKSNICSIRWIHFDIYYLFIYPISKLNRIWVCESFIFNLQNYLLESKTLFTGRQVIYMVNQIKATQQHFQENGKGHALVIKYLHRLHFSKGKEVKCTTLIELQVPIP